MRMTICRSSWLVGLVAGALAAPAAVAAQDTIPPAPAPRTHVVRPGDTLWEIARIYLADPFLWPEVYRVNTALVDDPHWIFPGQTLQIPGGAGGPVIVAEAPPDEQVIPVEPAPQPVGVVYEPMPAASTGPTVFSDQMRRARGSSNLREIQAQTRTAVRRGEFRAAPWVDRDGGPRGAGRVVQSMDLPGVAAASDRIRYQSHEPLYVLPPAGVVFSRGERYLTARLGPELPGLGQVVVPTGIVEIEEAYEGDDVASVARLVAQYDEVRQGDRLVALEPFDMQPGVRPAPVTSDVSARVVWIEGEPVLPSVLRYVVVDASTRDGMRLGDQITLVRPTQRNSGGVTLPEQEIAIAQVVRVTPYGVTALVIDQVQPAIRPGTLARLTARMP